MSFFKLISSLIILLHSFIFLRFNHICKLSKFLRKQQLKATEQHAKANHKMFTEREETLSLVQLFLWWWM